MTFLKSLDRCQHLHRLSRKDSAPISPSKDISHPGQCVLPQGQKCLDVVFRSPKIHRGFQSSGLFSGVQCPGTHLASHAIAWYTQPLFLNTERTAFCPDLYVSKYPKKSVTSARLFAAVPIIMSRYLYKAI